MTKNIKKNVAALSIATVMGVGGFGIAKLAQMPTTASADTGYSTRALNVSEGTIGLNQSATVNVTGDAPATLALNNVAAGQYMIVAKIIEATGEYYWIDLSATANDFTSFLSENEALDAFVGTVTVNSDSTIELSTWSDAVFTVEVWLQPLAIGQFNDYYLSGIEISSTASKQIALDGVTGKYLIVVETYDVMSSDAEIMVNGKTLTKNPDMYDAWTTDLTLTDVASLVLSTTNSEMISVNLTLREFLDVTDELPTAAADAEEFAIYEERNFKYVAEDDGYFTVSSHASVANAEMSIVLKTDANNYDGTVIEGENYPIYLEAFAEYCLTVTYMGTPWEEDVETPQSVDAWFTVSEWSAPTLELNAEAVYVPVTAESEDEVTMFMNVEAGTYDLNLLNVPFEILFGGYTVTAHFGAQKVDLEWGYAQITVTDETSIWFTTNYATGFTAGVRLSSVVSYDTIMLNEYKEVSLAGDSSDVFYIDDLAVGSYKVTIISPDGAQILVESSISDDPVISVGGVEGTFEVATEGATVALIITNMAETYVDFSIIVTDVVAE